LLGLTLANHEVSVWLAAHHLEATELETDICARYGISLAPFSVELDESPIPLAETVSADSKIVYADAVDNLGAATVEIDRGAVNGAAHGESERSSMEWEADGVPDAPASNVESAKSQTADSKPADSKPAEVNPLDSKVDERRALLRILDASANRAGEAVRVVEDYVRFALDDSQLTHLCKEIRHDLKAALSQIAAVDRLAARDTPRDVGTSLTTATERRRDDLFDVAAANVRRLQESLRSLEEFGKLLDPGFAAECERLRYRSYTLQQVIARTVDARAQLAGVRLYVLVDGRETPEAFESLVDAVLAGGADVVQLRDKRLDDRALLDRAARLRRRTRAAGRLFIMNDRADLAVAADADGVHVGQDELSPAEARRIVGSKRLVGVSTHSIEQLRQAVLDGADYVGLGPTFPSDTKRFDQFPGLEYLRAAAAETKLPAFAIGGITAETVASVVATGIDRVAVSGAVINSPDPTAVLREIRGRMG
jgi:thiamine-phosphate pyrophosphorylase